MPIISCYVSYGKHSSNMYEQTRWCHESLQHDFIANRSAVVWVSWKIVKGEKDKAFYHHWKQEKVTNNVLQGLLQNVIHQKRIQNPIKDLRWSILRNWLLVRKKPGVNFSLVKLLVAEKNQSPLKNWSLFTD